MKRITLHRIYNETDIPQFGCGRRTVLALPPGRKWITVIDPFTLDVAHVHKSTWQRLRPEAVEVRRHVIIAAMKHRMEYFKDDEGRLNITDAIKQAYKLARGKNE